MRPKALAAASANRCISPNLVTSVATATALPPNPVDIRYKGLDPVGSPRCKDDACTLRGKVAGSSRAHAT